MILRDGRRQLHDLGPHRTFQPSLMRGLGVMGGFEGTGGWSRERACKRSEPVGATLTQPAPQMTPSPTPEAKSAGRPRARRPAAEKQAYDRAYSRRNRQRRREQLRSWRARRRLDQ